MVGMRRVTHTVKDDYVQKGIAQSAPVRHTADMTDKPILNVRETCDVLACDPKTLRKRVKQGVYPPYIPGSKPPKWRAADVHAFVAAGGICAA